MAAGRKQQIHLRVSPEIHAFLKGQAEARGEGLSETLEYLIGRLMKTDDTFFVRHSAGQSFAALYLVAQLAQRTFEIDYEEARAEDPRGEAAARVEQMMRDAMREAWRVFGPAPKAPVDDYVGNDRAADGMSAALAEAFKLPRR